MADKKISQLTNLTGASLAEDDEFVLVDTSADETKAITWSELKEGLDTGTGFVRITGDTMTGDLTVPNVVVSGNVDGRDVSADGTKLDGIEAGATADQTKADIDALNVDADTLDGQHGAYYTGYTDTAVANLVDAAPSTLDTLNELAAALGDDPNFATTVTNSVATKLPLSGGAMTGPITTNSTFDGRNVSVDGTKLDGIEAGADVTDTANVTSAGALMDSEVTNLTQVKAFDSADYATAAQGVLADASVQTTAATGQANLPAGTTAQRTATPATGALRFNSTDVSFEGYDGTEWGSIGGGGGGIAYTRHTANVTMAANEGVIADTSGGAFTVTLPASPATGDTVVITDGADWATTNLTVGRNGSTIEGDAADMTMDIGGVAVQFTYDGTTWQIYTQLGAAGGNVVSEGDSPTFNAVTATSYAGDGSSLTGIAAGAPAGAVIYHAANAPPTGFIKANGASLSTTTYADLFAVIGYTFGGSGSSFSVPDLRGEFMRGWDDSRGIDSSRAFGSAQADELESHNHSWQFATSTGGNTYFNSGRVGSPSNGGGSAIGSTGGSETRPRNIALLACIKY